MVRHYRKLFFKCLHSLAGWSDEGSREREVSGMASTLGLASSSTWLTGSGQTRGLIRAPTSTSIT